MALRVAVAQTPIDADPRVNGETVRSVLRLAAARGAVGGAGAVRASPDAAFVLGDIDRGDPSFHVALDLARPWRAEAWRGGIFARRAVSDDPRSIDRTIS